MANETTVAAADLNVDAAAGEIIALFKGPFLNPDRLISRTCPPSSRTIFDNFDDVAPFLLYFGEEQFLLEQVSRLDETSFERLLAVEGVLYAYKIDEYLGGLNAVFRRTGDARAKRLLVDAIDKCIRYFVDGNHFAEFFDLRTRTRSHYFSPWSAGLLETFLEVTDLRPDLLELTERVFDGWTEVPFVRRYGLFPFRGTRNPVLAASSRVLAATRRFCQEYEPGDADGLLGRLKGRLRLARYYYTASGEWAQTMKSNTTPVFTMIELFRRTGHARWAQRVDRWIEAAKRSLIDEEGVHKTWVPPCATGAATLVDGFIVMDLLCEAWRSIDRRPAWLALAGQIGETCLAWEWPIGVIPMTRTADRDHLDGQVDFSIAVRRFAELAGRSDLRHRSFQLLANALRLHRTAGGYCTHVNRRGEPIELPVNMVDPKYNGLLLKGLIHLKERDRDIYSPPQAGVDLSDLFKDR